jgi:cob(I)alamin adenosyltransferase
MLTRSLLTAACTLSRCSEPRLRNRASRITVTRSLKAGFGGLWSLPGRERIQLPGGLAASELHRARRSLRRSERYVLEPAWAYRLLASWWLSATP